MLQLSTQVTLFEPGARRSRKRSHRAEAEAILSGKEIYTQPELPELMASEPAETETQKGSPDKTQKTAAQENSPDKTRQSLNEEKKNTEE